MFIKKNTDQRVRDIPRYVRLLLISDNLLFGKIKVKDAFVWTTDRSQVDHLSSVQREA